ncbi:methionine--tRNA ligase [Candidatus Falkowbacteria bacterium]|nr:methionine--tRNA ligase [Candidatus Falkowbacteria bacterium]
MKKYYITTAIPYVNAQPHIGHAFEFVQADVLKRFVQMHSNQEVVLLSGSDENSLKNVQAAQKAGKETNVFVDEHAQFFKDTLKALSIDVDVFQKGSDQATHIPSSQKLWELCAAHGDIYKKSYEGLYCVGCEAFYTADELNEAGECFEHPGKELEKIKEENYFFKLSAYQDQLIKIISSGELEIIPQERKNEVLSFLSQPLQDISISRSNERAQNWGVPVPGDASQKMYVWFDALNIYQSGIGFGTDEKQYETTWPADVHVIGKGILRFHAIYWPAFLLSAGLQLPKKLFVHGYITVDGQKMSKSIGNVINPNDLLQKYSTDALRYYFMREIPATGDGDFSEKRFVDIYNAHLAGGVGNLLARVTAMHDKYSGLEVTLSEYEDPFDVNKFWKTYDEYGNKFELDAMLRHTFTLVDAANKYIDDTKPWEKAKTDVSGAVLNLTQLLEAIRHIALALYPYMPSTSRKIMQALGKELDKNFAWGGVTKGDTITKGVILFPRIEINKE